MKKRSKLIMFCTICFISLTSLTAFAASLTITNPSFEDPSLGDGVWNNQIPGWTITGGAAGVWNPKAFQSSVTDPPQDFVDTLPDGVQVAYSNGGDLTQTLSDVITPGYKYTFSVWVGGRSSAYANRPYAAILFGGTQKLFEHPGNNPINDWFQVTGSYTSPVGDPNAGLPLIITLMNYDGTQLNFDKVELYASLVMSCQGFLPPFDKALTLKAKDSRAIPVKMILQGPKGNIITDTDIAPPIINVTYAPAVTIAGASADLVPNGLSDSGNAFRYDPYEQLWILNLATKQFSAPGTYTVTVAPGDASYSIEGCSQTFTRN